MGTRLGSLAALVVLALAALVSATYDGPDWEAGRSGGERSADSSDEAPAAPRDGSATDVEDADPGDGPGRDDRRFTAPLTILMLLFVVGAVVAIAVAVGLRLVLHRRHLAGDRPPRAGPPPAPDTEPDREEPEQPDAVIDHALHDLAEGEPRNAIVAMWQHLERLLHGDRFHRHPADTPTEYAERARSSYPLDGAALDELAALYREARFSRHPITERHRDRAHACLTRLQDDLREHVP